MIEKLRRMPLFCETAPGVLERLIQEKQITERFFHKGTTVHEQGSECGAMDIVCSGKLIAYSLSPNGSETIVFEFEAGSMVGANLLFGSKSRYPMNIYSVTDSVLLHVARSGVEKLLEEYGFVMPFVRSLSANSQGMNQKLAIYTRGSLRENLMDYFLALSAQQNSRCIVLPITKKQLADYFGVQRPSLFRELKRMKDEGLLEIKNKKITIQYS